MIEACSLMLAIVGPILITYFLVELNYLLRSLVYYISANFFKKRTFILDETTVTGICLSTDVDYLLNHMNNARYIRELDFAKLDFYERTMFHKTVTSKGGAIFVAATTIRYRKFIKIFSRYKLSTKIIYWDSQHIYIEHKFLSMDKFVNAIAISKVRLMNCDTEEVMQVLLQHTPKNLDVEAGRRVKPPIPVELVKWNEYNQVSSQKLRSENTSGYVQVV
ncbi:hypothetical protein GWI33_010687 [Rhynchophorus ferrugineus]|uniref:Protein THEM6 n=1 Tax=Rhynchophorus ferrugineus TaxID=354439 RepID=A0A834ICV0_RHYFE|nr:hypothetical protein GWI33_010687 [Rhynchophorus ferrugineus]